MKNIYLYFALLIVFVTNAQIINIPDPVFKALLLLPNSSIVQGTAGLIDLDLNNDLEIEVSEALLVRRLFLDNKNLNSLSGIEYFTNLEWLYCKNNNLTSLDLTASTNLYILDCDYNDLISLNITGLGNLHNLSCIGNQLTSLDINGCDNLLYLECANNQITALDVSQLSDLIKLTCFNNQIPGLNFHPNDVNLNYVSCGHNFLTTLILPNANPFNNLIFLDCNDNLLTTLTVVGHPDLQILRCYNNQLNTLTVLGLTALEELDCSDNELTNLTVTDFPVLDYVDCGNNQLNNLNLTGVPRIVDLYCQYNNLTDLDLSQLYKLKRLGCGNNPLLTTLNIKNGSYESNLYLTYTLRYICADEMQTNEGRASLNNTQIDVLANCMVSSYCSFIPGGVFYTMQGAVRYDLDSNGCDSSDILVANQKIKLRTTNVGIDPIEAIRFTNATGNYFQPGMSGFSTLTPILENPAYYIVSPTTANVSFPSAVSPHNQDFCITANGVHNDLQIELMPFTLRGPGFNSSYYIIYKNKGTAVQSGSIPFTFDDGVLDFIQAIPSAATETAGSLSWDFVNLAPFETRVIELRFRLNAPTDTPPLNAGAVLQYNANIIGLTDETPANNSAVMIHTVVNSYDPNDKTCLEGITVAPEMVGKEVHYKIRFENTGTANAQNIVVKDMIDTYKFDINSLIAIEGSHPFVTKVTGYNKVEFIFENINLPFDDANNDGYVAFKIKTKPTLVLGDTFSNTANIYFDYNFPIVTNNYTTTIAALAQQDFDFPTYFVISPNPAKDQLNIENIQSIAITSVSIYNALGQLILVIPNAKEVRIIDVSDFKTGAYFIKINTDRGTTNAKFVKQ